MKATIATLALALALAGCGTSPKTHFYTLGAIPPAGAGGATHVTGRPLQVGPVALPASLDRLSMVMRGAGDQVNVSDQDRWVSPLDGLIRQVMTEDLSARLGPDHVLAPGDPAPPGGVRGLMLNVQRFAAVPGGQVVLEVDWDLGSGGKSGTPHHAEIHVPIEGQGGEAIAHAMSQAVAKLADRVAAER